MLLHLATSGEILNLGILALGFELVEIPTASEAAVAARQIFMYTSTTGRRSRRNKITKEAPMTFFGYVTVIKWDYL